MKKYIWILLVLFLIPVCFIGCASLIEYLHNNCQHIVILTTADLQSNILPFEAEIDGEERMVGGFEKIKTVYEYYKNKADAVLLVSTGDDLFGPFYKIFEGTPEIEGMNLTGYSVVTCGNHEFDNGAAFYLNALQKAEFDVVSANLSLKEDASSLIKPYVLKNINGITIGFFGLITPDLKKLANVGDDVEVDKDFIGVAENMVDELKQKGADIIVVLSHMGVNLDRELARSVSGIDFIIGGHDHEYVYEEVTNPSGKKTIIVQDGARGIKLGVLSIDLFRSTIIGHNWETILLDESIEGNKEIHDKMQAYMDEYDQETEKVIGESLVDLEARESVIRSQETNLGNFVADSWTAWEEGTIALVNSGSIRGDKIYPAGDITYKTALEILPFMNEVFEVQVTGETLKQILEISASAIRVPGDGCDDENRASTGGFLQVSNIYFDIDLSEKPFCAIYNDDRTVAKILNNGERIKNVRILKDGHMVPLNLSETYTILVNAWMVSGGDGYYIFLDPDIPQINTTNIAVDLLIDHIERLSPIAPRVEGRINIINGS